MNIRELVRGLIRSLSIVETVFSLCNARSCFVDKSLSSNSSLLLSLSSDSPRTRWESLPHEHNHRPRHERPEMLNNHLISNINSKNVNNPEMLDEIW